MFKNYDILSNFLIKGDELNCFAALGFFRSFFRPFFKANKCLNLIMKHEPDLRNWMEAWSIGPVYEIYEAGGNFFLLPKVERSFAKRAKFDQMILVTFSYY